MMNALLLPALVIGGTALLSVPLGRWLARAMDPAPDDAAMRRATGLFTAIAGPAAARGQSWKAYGLSLLLANLVAFAIAFLILMTQQYLPLNPDGKGALSPDLAFHTAASFVTNTNLQHYSGEQSMSYFSQLFALMWLQFITPAMGLAVLAAIARGLAGRPDLGNFWMDTLRASFLVLLPLALVWALTLVALGVPTTLDGAAAATTLENAGMWSNLLQTVGILIVPMACIWMFGRIIGRPRHARLIFVVMLAFLVAKLGLALWFESAPVGAFQGLPITAEANLEGKEMRLGGSASVLWAVVTTSTSNGSVNAMMDSLNPLTGLIPMVDMWLNSTFGGIGVGLVNMWLYMLVAVFLAGMLIGRTPAYLGHRIEAREVRLAVLGLLLHAVLERSGFAAIEAATAREALKATEREKPDLVLLDLGLPDQDGLELLPFLARHAAVIALTARDATDDKVAALDLGAIDYVVKPFDTEELLARIRAGLRNRARSMAGAEIVGTGAVRINLATREVFRDGLPLHLPPREFDLLLELARHPGRVLTHRHLLTAVWGQSHVEDVTYLRVAIRAIRAKLEADPSRPTLIVNDPGIGYRLIA